MRVVVYGVGKEYEKQKVFLEKEYEIVAVTDQNSEVLKKFDNSVILSKLNTVEYDNIYITSSKYYDEIRQNLIENIGISEEKIISPFDVWWHISNSDTRDRWVKQQLRSFNDGKSILDAGAGNCRYKKYCSHLMYSSQDFGEYDDSPREKGINGVDKWESKKCDIICDIAKIPVEDGNFDYVMCTEVLEHVKDPVVVVKELSRVLKTGGELLLTAPFCSLTHMAPFYFSNGFSKYWYQEWLTNSGLEIIEIRPYGNYFSYLAQELQRIPEMSKKTGVSLSEEECDRIYEMTKTLVRQSREEKEFDEILCFGYLVRAKKK